MLGDAEYDRVKLCEIAKLVEIDRLDMPSFNELRIAIKKAIISVCGQVNE